MAIAFDASAEVYQGSATGSQSLSHTCTGTDLVLVVFTRTYDGDGVSGVTYNSVAMTQVGGTQVLGSDRIKAWLLHNPSTGANNIVATISPDRRIEIYSVSLTGALQASAADATAYATGTGTAASGTVVTVTDNAWAVANTEANGASGGTVSGTNCTVANQINDRGAIGYGGPKTPAGSFAQTMTWAGSGDWSFFQVAIAPAGAAGGGPDFLTLLGVS